jgi:hypothetical protein
MKDFLATLSYAWPLINSSLSMPFAPTLASAFGTCFPRRVEISGSTPPATVNGDSTKVNSDHGTSRLRSGLSRIFNWTSTTRGNQTPTRAGTIPTSDIAVPSSDKNCQTISNIPDISFGTEDATPSPQELSAARSAISLIQVLRWRETCPPGKQKDHLSELAHQLADGAKNKYVPMLAIRLLEDPDGMTTGGGKNSWESVNPSILLRFLAPGSSPLSFHIDPTKLGVWALTGIISSRLWSEPGMQQGHGSDDYQGCPNFAPPPEAPSLSTYASATIANECVNTLLACDAMTDVRKCLDSTLARFGTLPGRNSPDAGSLHALITELREARASIDHHDASSLGKALLRLDDRPAHCIPQVLEVVDWDRRRVMS